jgi:hypothetical protein
MTLSGGATKSPSRRMEIQAHPRLNSNSKRFDNDARPSGNSIVSLLCGLASRPKERLKGFEFPPCLEICLIHLGDERRKLVPPH